MRRIEVEDFQGPVDLLLTLVQQEELSLTRIHLLEILTQIINGLEETPDLNESGDLLIIISTLMELKSKLLLPGEVNIGEEIQALKEDLLTKVLVHRRLSQVLEALDFRYGRRSQMHARPPQLSDKEEVILPIRQQNPFVLFSSLSGLLEKARTDSYRVDYVILPIDYYFDWLDNFISGKSFSLIEILKQRKDQLDMSGVLIAVLELIRQGKLEIELGENTRDIQLHWREPDEEWKSNLAHIEN